MDDVLRRVRCLTPERWVFAAGWLASCWFAYRAARFAFREGKR